MQRSLCRWRRIRSITRGSGMKETIRMRSPHEQTRGSVSKIFLTKRAQVLRASLAKSELSLVSGAGAVAPGLSACSPAQTILPRLEYAP